MDPSRRQFYPNTAGTYLIALRVADSRGVWSCVEETVRVTVAPFDTLYVQILWDNPQDPDQTDFDGADLNLHLLKQTRGAQWFDTFDCTSGNRSPDWFPEAPIMIMEDFNGAGPEAISLDNPEQCQWYAVGVDYMPDRDFGPAHVTMSIFVNGAMVAQHRATLEKPEEFWDAARIHWPSGEVLLVDSLHQQLPLFEPVPLNQDQLDSDLCR